VLLHDVTFEGQSFPANRLRIQQLSEGVYELTGQRDPDRPAGEWIEYGSGKHFSGSNVVIADAPLDVLPLYARAGAIISKIPDDVMTLVPPEQSGNASVKSLDDRRVYELWPTGSDFKSDAITDFEGRTLSRTAHSLEINGHAARVTVRWRFDPVTSVTPGDTPLELHSDAGGRYVGDGCHVSLSLSRWPLRLNATLLWCATGKIRSFVDAAAALIAGNLRIWAQGPRAIGLSRR
jgi:hypothetical protein